MRNAVKFLLSMGMFAGAASIAACSSAPTTSDSISTDAGSSAEPTDAGTSTSNNDASTTTTTPTSDAGTSTTDPACAGVVCNSPPSATCTTSEKLTSYAATGTCSGGTCSYAKSTTTCACESGACETYGPATQVDAYDVAACALTSTGKIMCWGSMLSYGFGELPVALTSFDSVSVKSISVGDDAICILTTTGGVKCTGNGANGAIGSSQTGAGGINFTKAFDVDGLASGVTSLSCGTGFCCAVISAGGAKCWGWNGDGEIGNGTKVNALTPVDVSGHTSNVASVTAGSNYACALTTSGAVSCWGSNDSGQLGNGGTTPSLVPVAATGLSSGVASVSAGTEATCAVTTGGAVKCWGANTALIAEGQTDYWGSTTPLAVGSLSSGVANVSAGGFIDGSCGLTSSGIVQCWSYDSSEISLANVLTSASMVSVGYDFGCGLTTTGGVRCWGEGSHGELGNGSTSEGSDLSVIGFP